jgi:hypothetical protein
MNIVSVPSTGILFIAWKYYHNISGISDLNLKDKSCSIVPFHHSLRSSRFCSQTYIIFHGHSPWEAFGKGLTISSFLK